MRNFLFAMLAATALVGAASTARADDFRASRYDDMTGRYAVNVPAFITSLNAQSNAAQDADPTAPNSIRSHGQVSR